MADRLGERAAESTRDHAHSRVRAAGEVLVGGYVLAAGTFLLVGLLLTKVLLTGPLGDADEGATRWLAEHRTSALDAITNVFSRSADTLSAVGIALVIALVLAIGRHWRYIVALALGLGLELSIFLTVNFLVDRPRPDVVKLNADPSTSSFPSGHTAATTVIWLLVAIFICSRTARPGLRMAGWFLAIALPIAVAFSRVYRGMHNPIDVACGILIGIAAITIALAAVRAGSEPEASTSREASDADVAGVAA